MPSDLCKNGVSTSEIVHLNNFFFKRGFKVLSFESKIYKRKKYDLVVKLKYILLVFLGKICSVF